MGVPRNACLRALGWSAWVSGIKTADPLAAPVTEVPYECLDSAPPVDPRWRDIHRGLRASH